MANTTTTNRREHSIRLSAALDSIGFSEEEVILRRSMDAVQQELYSHKWCPDDQIKTVSSGSTAEAAVGGSYAATKTSDTDMMHIWKCFHTVEEDMKNINYGDKKHLLKILDTDCHPGYTLLQLIKLGNQRPYLKHVSDFCAEDAHGRTLVCPKLMKNLIKRNALFGPEVIIHNKHEQGPAVTSMNTLRSRHFDKYENTHFECDQVIAIDSSWPKQAVEWVKRKRFFDWPNKSTIDEIVRNGCLLVATGYSLSGQADLEWRLSFSLAEKLLIRGFNSVQLKCYGLLKIVLNHVIKPVLPGIFCSYYMKTAMFWLIEATGRNLWQDMNLVHCFLMAIGRLETWMNNENIPNYFIPNNNMLDHKLDINFKDKRPLIFKTLASIKQDYWIKTITCQTFQHITSIACDKSLNIVEVVRKLELLSFFSVLRCLAFSDAIYVNKTFDSNIKTILQTLISKETHEQKHMNELIIETLQKHTSCFETMLLKPVIGLLQSSLASLIAHIDLLENSRIEEDVLKQSLGENAGSDLFCGPLRFASYLHWKRHFPPVLQICRNISRTSHDKLLPNGEPSWNMASKKEQRYKDKWNKLSKESRGKFYKDTSVFCKTGYIHNTSELNSVEFDGMPSYIHGLFGFDVFFSFNDIMMLRPAIAYEIWARLTSSESTLIYLHPFVYVYYLMFITETILGNDFESSVALQNLEKECENISKAHRSISYNILGYCYVAQGDDFLAFRQFAKSLEEEPTISNAACWHMAELLNRQVNGVHWLNR